MSVDAASIDLDNTQARFTAKHLLISTVQGFIPIKSVQIALGANNVPTSIQAALDLSKLNTSNDQRDGDLRSDQFFDVQRFPTMTFASTKITPQSGGSFVMAGNLTMHGVTKPVSLNGTVGATMKDSQGKTHVGYTATGTVDRTQWGVGSGYPDAIVGNAISITIAAEAIL
ncbi:MAG: YceI family protein [Candidatus Eremiobacteraeota bacterium]|nr:YceI family protein [Candidatus Eremiobacteraeota bacterium]